MGGLPLFKPVTRAFLTGGESQPISRGMTMTAAKVLLRRRRIFAARVCARA